MRYDYIVVGSGLYGACFARIMTDAGKNVLILEKRDHIGGNCYTEEINGILVHKYGPHIFHTNDENVWDFVNRFADFNDFVNEPLANYKGELYNLPFNLNTFQQMWGVESGEEAKAIIAKQIDQAGIKSASNLEEQAISLVGTDIYEKLIKGYTEKQWGRDCKDLPASIIKRIPVRFEANNNYYDAKYQGIPEHGYTKLIENLLSGIEVKLGIDYLNERSNYENLADKIVFTGMIDAYFDYKYGELEYRSLRFETEFLSSDNYQDNAVINYTDAETPWTRIIEHKWFNFGKAADGKEISGTVISREYSQTWNRAVEAYYPINDDANNILYARYKSEADKLDNVIFGGRLAEYKYYDMDQVVLAAMQAAESER